MPDSLAEKSQHVDVPQSVPSMASPIEVQLEAKKSEATVVAPAASAAPVIQAAIEQASPPVVIATPNGKVMTRRQVDLQSYRQLLSHVLAGRAVVPAAVMTKWLADVALSAHPGLFLAGVESMTVFRGLPISRDEGAEVRAKAGRLDKIRNSLRSLCELESGNESQIRRQLHAKATIMLSTEPPSATESHEHLPELAGVDWQLQADEIYPDVLFHGPNMQMIRHVRGCDAQPELIEATLDLSQPWIDPEDGTSGVDVMALDAAFQLAIVWCVRHTGDPSLPVGFGAYRQYVSQWTKAPINLRMRMRRRTSQKVVADFEWLDPAGQRIAAMRDYSCVTDGSLRTAFVSNRIEGMLTP